MSRPHAFKASVFLVSICTLAGVLRLTLAESPPAKDTPAPTLTATLGGDDRCLTHVSTDKPLYRPGETLFVRGVLLNEATHKPLAKDKQLTAAITITGPKGDTVSSGQCVSVDSTLGFQWTIPEAQAGGEYTIKVAYGYVGQPPAERKFDIRAYRTPRLKTQVKFLRDGYGAGDEVVAMLHTERAEGGIPADRVVTAIARVDGVEAYRGQTKIDAKGDCQARFKLPKDIKRGEGTLALVIEDGGVVETASKTIPILLQTVDLNLYPEGGELVAGLPNRVYFSAFTPAQKPADLAGVVVDAAGKEVGRFRSEHEGRGRFAFTPAKGGKYSLKITEPSGIKTQYSLPEVKESGVVLSSASDVTKKGEEVALSLGAATAGEYRVVICQREREVATKTINLKAGESQVLKLAVGAGEGVLRATVYDSTKKPLVERLLFREPAQSVQVKLTADNAKYVPGGKAKIQVQTSTPDGKPLSAVVGVTVTDDSVREMIEKREQSPRLPVMVLLEGEVKELADAHVYLDPANEKAPLATDLLLGTQGWRRFAFADTTKFAAAHGDAARRVLALKLATVQDLSQLSDNFDFKEGNRFRFGAPRPAALEAKNEPQAEAAKPLPADDAKAPVGDLKPPALGNVKGGGGGFARELPAEPKDRQDLQRSLEKAEAAAGAAAPFAKRKSVEVRNDFPAVRIYAHEVRSQRQPGQRVDFAETLYFAAGLRTDDKGMATVEFGLNDSVTSFQVAADTFSDDGALGSTSLAIESVEPFYLEPKLPLEVTTGDTIRLPLGYVNGTAGPLENGTLRYQVEGPKKLDLGKSVFSIPANGRVRQILDLKVGQDVGTTKVTLDASAGPFGDKVTRTLMVKPLGFPQQLSAGGLLAASSTTSHDFVIPKTVVPGSLEARVVVYPTPLANMNEALAALIQEPCGCFEQTSSTTYPLVMAQQYFMTHQGVDPALIERSGRILETGYQRLTGYECKGGGYEWFGADPGHDALTAYGLLEFTDMAQVRSVDFNMLERTRKWLLDQRDGKGGYARKTHTLHTWIADPECANSYNTWALLEAGVRNDLKTEVTWIRTAGEKAQNTYAVALAANVVILAGDKDGENHLLDKLSGLQVEDGSLKGATTSVIGSGGEALTIETTALATLAWLKNPKYAANVEKSIKYLAECCKGGRYGSTQSTVLALRAIVAYDKARAKPTTPGSLQLLVDGKEIGQPVPFTPETTGAIELPAIAELLSPGKHQVQVTMKDGSSMPFSVAIKFNAVTPDSSDKCKLNLEVKLRDARIEEGAATEADVVVINRTGEIIPTPIAIIGLPGGLEPRHDQLKELVKSKKIDAYEVIGREVVLYWRSLDKEARVELPLSLIAAVPGSYTGPASRTYLYYTDEHKQWVTGMKVEIAAKP